MSMTRRRWHCGGFTLIELVVAIVIVSVGAVGLLSVYSTSVRYGADPMVRKQAMALADSILEEVLLKPYEDPDGLPNTVEASRALFDDVDDYNGVNETISATGPIFLSMPAGLYGYGVRVDVVGATLGSVAAKRVTVTVSRGGDSITMTGYRTQDPT